jgi:thiosulfate dehydrogenase
MTPKILLVLLLASASAFAAGVQISTVKALPADSSIPAGPEGVAIKLGRDIINDTLTQAKGYVGNGLNCASCHKAGGTTPGALPFPGLSGQFPQYNARAGKVITLQDRVNGCFTRSMNGKPLPLESQEMTAIMAYTTWLSKDIPSGQQWHGRGSPKVDLTGLSPNLENGKKVFAAQCAACHGATGAGLYANGKPTFPALWGDKSFNIGAGMARLFTATPFVKANMPLTSPGSLSVQDALDVSAYFTTQPRPDLASKSKDWPNGGRPKDARY